MKTYLLMAVLLILNIIFSEIATASDNCKHVYTIGAYDKAFAKHATILKLGPLAAANVPPEIPKSFLEKEGNYAGGEAFCTIAQACRVLKKQLASGGLPKTGNWHIYLLDAHWNQDTYKLRSNDFRIKHSVKVLQVVKKHC